jgi:hypothetical protein
MPISLRFLMVGLAVCTTAAASNAPRPSELSRWRAGSQDGWQVHLVDKQERVGESHESPIRIVQEEDGVYWAIDPGIYLNEDYGFQVSVPDGLRALGCPPPMPNHGFFIRSATNPGVRLDVDAYYNAMFFADVEAVADNELAMRGRSYRLRFMRRSRTRLGGLSAIRQVLRYEMREPFEGAGQARVMEQVFALRRDFEDDIGIIYGVRLDSPEALYAGYREMLQEILKGWSTLPLE